MGLSEKTIRVNNLNVHYWEDGVQHGKPVLLLHGGFGDAWTHWKEVIPLLAEQYRVLAPDLPGYSQSDPLGNVRVAALVDWLRGFMDAAGVDQAVLIGSSFSGLVVRLLAASIPERVPALVLVNGGVIPDAPTFAKILARIPLLGKTLFNRIAASTSSRSELVRIFGASEALTDEFVARTGKNREALGRLMQGLTISAIPAGRTPLMPVLLLWGEEDTVTPVWAGENIKNAIPGAKLSLVAGCGHMPQIEAPEVFATQVLMFLNNMDRSQRDLPGAGLLNSNF